MLATAEDIPPELYDLILDFLSVDMLGQYEPYYALNNVALNKRELGSCARVCRAWADVCQRKIFAHVTLRAREDVDTLIALLAAPRSRIALYVNQLRLVLPVPLPGTGLRNDKTKPPPWVHLACLALPSKLPHRRCTVTLYVGTVDQSDTIGGAPHTEAGSTSSIALNVEGVPILGRTVHSALPRSYPAFSSAIRTLHLTALAFRRFADLAHLCAELPALGHLECRRVSWPKASQGHGPGGYRTYFATSTSRLVRRDVQVGLTQCTDDAVAVLFGGRVLHAAPARPCDSELAAVLNLASALAEGIPTVQAAEPIVTVKNNALGATQFRTVSRYFRAPRGHDMLTFDCFAPDQSPFAPHLSVYCTSESVPTTPTTTRLPSVVTLTIWFECSGRPLAEIPTLAHHWQAISTWCVSAGTILPALRGVVLAFDTRTDCAWFARRATNLNKVKDTDGTGNEGADVRYVVWNGQEGRAWRWVPVPTENATSETDLESACEVNEGVPYWDLRLLA